MAVDQKGIAYLTILSPYNEPVGNLHQMQLPLADLDAVAHGGRADARNSKAHCTMQPGHDDTVEMHYEDPENFRKSTSTVLQEDLQELIRSMPAVA